jgi:tRNA-specific 2-thiouridylase
LIDYTIGQRKGLGIAASHPLYVTVLDPVANAVIVGEAEHLEQHQLIASNMHYIRGVTPDEPLAVSVQVRAHAKEEYGTLFTLPNDQAKVVLERPLRGVAPGQALVVYTGERVVGAGILEADIGH